MDFSCATSILNYLVYIYIYIYLFIYLFYCTELNPATAESVRVNAKERKKEERQVRRVKKRKGIEVLRAKHPTASRAIDAIIGEEENEKQKNKKKEMEQVPNPATLDNSIASYYAQGSYGQPIHFTLWPTQGSKVGVKAGF